MQKLGCVGLAVGLCVVLAGCGSDDNGTAPHLDGPTPATSEAVVGVSETLVLRVQMEDPDGDIQQGVARITHPDGHTDNAATRPIQGLQGQTNVTVDLQVPFTATEVGEHVIELWCMDAGAHESNHVMHVVTATAPPP